MDIDVCDDRRKVCVRLRGFSVRVMLNGLRCCNCSSVTRHCLMANGDLCLSTWSPLPSMGGQSIELLVSLLVYLELEHALIPVVPQWIFVCAKVYGLCEEALQYKMFRGFFTEPVKEVPDGRISFSARYTGRDIMGPR